MRVFPGIIASGTLIAYCAAAAANAADQYPGAPGAQGARGGPSQPNTDFQTRPIEEKPDAAAKKAFKAGVKSLDKARSYTEQAQQAPTEDKRIAALADANDAYGKAIDQFTEALSNNGDMADAWTGACYAHLRIGAYREALDDCNHALKLKPDDMNATEYRGEAYLQIDRLDEAKSTYMDLSAHAPDQAAQLMEAMRRWLASHRTDARGMSAASIDSFDQWLKERDSGAHPGG